MIKRARSTLNHQKGAIDIPTERIQNVRLSAVSIMPDLGAWVVIRINTPNKKQTVSRSNSVANHPVNLVQTVTKHTRSVYFGWSEKHVFSKRKSDYDLSKLSDPLATANLRHF
jgi:hypothetical protein